MSKRLRVPWMVVRMPISALNVAKLSMATIQGVEPPLVVCKRAKGETNIAVLAEPMEAKTGKGSKRSRPSPQKAQPGFNPDDVIFSQDDEGKYFTKGDVTMFNEEDANEIRKNLNELDQYFPLETFAARAHIMQLTDPLSIVVYCPCSQKHLKKIQKNMMETNDLPLAAVVVPYTMNHNGDREFLTFYSEAQLLEHIENKGLLMINFGLHSMKAAKNILQIVGDNDSHVLYNRAEQLRTRHV
ncbi:hypothetical protein R1flu_015819 [Riccia fluitans]|uniref:Uncharacterized protein n=1 Tax=Riccia fluitans TaxID=41844 RepID=A0ABD1YKJ6_9MARC